MVHQNSSTVEFWQVKIEDNLRRANTKLSVDFRRANTEPTVCPEYDSGFNEVPASDSTSEWARNPN